VLLLSHNYGIMKCIHCYIEGNFNVTCKFPEITQILNPSTKMGQCAMNNRHVKLHYSPNPQCLKLMHISFPIMVFKYKIETWTNKCLDNIRHLQTRKGMRRAHGGHPTYCLKLLIMVGQILSILQMTKLITKLLTFWQFFISKETCTTMNISPRTLEVHTKLFKLENHHLLKLEFSCGLCLHLSSYNARFPCLNL